MVEDPCANFVFWVLFLVFRTEFWVCIRTCTHDICICWCFKIPYIILSLSGSLLPRSNGPRQILNHCPELLCFYQFTASSLNSNLSQGGDVQHLDGSPSPQTHLELIFFSVHCLTRPNIVYRCKCLRINKTIFLVQFRRIVVLKSLGVITNVINNNSDSLSLLLSTPVDTERQSSGKYVFKFTRSIVFMEFTSIGSGHGRLIGGRSTRARPRPGLGSTRVDSQQTFPVGKLPYGDCVRSGQSSFATSDSLYPKLCTWRMTTPTDFRCLGPIFAQFSHDVIEQLGNDVTLSRVEGGERPLRPKRRLTGS